MQSDKKLNKSILFICPFPFGVAAGQRLKYEQSIDYFKENGFEVEISSFMDLKMWEYVYKEGHHMKKIFGTIRGIFRRLKDVFRIRKYDQIYVFMWVTPIGTSLFERVFKLLSKNLIYDIEDNIFVEKANSINKLAKLIKGTGKTEFLVKHADHVITSSPFLNEYCLKKNKNKNCSFISSSIEHKRYIPKQISNDSKKLTIGWTGTFSSRPFLEEIYDVFYELKKIRDFKLVIIGNFNLSLEGLDLEVIQWTKDKEIEDLQKIDIGLYPLPNEDWVLGKSGLKALQYMAMGIPAVASKVGTAIDIIEHGKNGFLVESKKDWIDTLTLLLDDGELRKKTGLKGRETIEQKYSVDIIKRQYFEVINEIY